MARPAIDWDDIHRRLAATERALAGSVEPSPEKARRVLAARARALARVPAVPEAGEHLEVLTFALAGETWAVETRWVREVCQLRALTALPGTPPFLAGLMNLRGQILAVVDLRRFFDLPPRGLTELNRIVVLREGSREVGLLADSVEGLRSVAVASLQQGLTSLAGVRERFLKGVTGQMLAVLDGGRLLDDAALRASESPSG
jgi:purine-binding chemotaxis protein CheW